jgi:enoyl-CoA hydratase/carnithine racemase
LTDLGTDPRVSLQVNGPVATITLRNPGKRNAMTRSMWRSLRSLAEDLANYENSSYLARIYLGDSPIRCIIVAGEAGHFCAGGDITEYPEFRFNAGTLQVFHEADVAPALHALLALNIPLVAQIEGNCMGGGLEIAACCDMRIAGQGASFGAPIAKLGMPMAPQELAIVLRAAGDATVREMLLEARIFSAQHMHQRGFVQRVVDDGAVAGEALATAQRVAALSAQAARLNKATLRANWILNSPTTQENAAQAAIKNEANTAAHFAYAASAEHVEGITAFLEKRPPKFV